jgi:AraC-like DNA-binding protein
VLLLGRAGVPQVVDARTPRGWRVLRDALSTEHLPDAFRRHAVASVLAEIGEIAGSAQSAQSAQSAHAVTEVATGCARFFALVFTPRAGSAKAVAAGLGVHPTTLCSRFARAGLPSPKRYAMAARLVLVARFAERRGASFGDLADRLGVSSSQSLGRAIRAATGLRAAAFREAFDGERMLRHFRTLLVTPYRDRLRDFDPECGGAARCDADRVSGDACAPRTGRAA